MTPLGQWRVLSRPECSLCEAMLGELVQLFGAQAERIGVVDISGDAELERRFGQRIPVLLIDDEFVCAYRLDQSRIQPFLAE